MAVGFAARIREAGRFVGHVQCGVGVGLERTAGGLPHAVACMVPVAGATQVMRDQVRCGAQVLHQARFHDEAAVLAQVMCEREQGGGDDYQTDGDAHHQLDDRQATLTSAGVHRFQQRLLSALELAACSLVPDA
jgi:hypothetical protein